MLYLLFSVSFFPIFSFGFVFCFFGVIFPLPPFFSLSGCNFNRFSLICSQFFFFNCCTHLSVDYIKIYHIRQRIINVIILISLLNDALVLLAHIQHLYIQTYTETSLSNVITFLLAHYMHQRINIDQYCNDNDTTNILYFKFYCFDLCFLFLFLLFSLVLCLSCFVSGICN